MFSYIGQIEMFLDPVQICYDQTVASSFPVSFLLSLCRNFPSRGNGGHCMMTFRGRSHQFLVVE